MRRSGEKRTDPVVVEGFAAASIVNDAMETPTLTAQSWWARGKAANVFGNALSERIIADLIADLAVMPRVITADTADSAPLTAEFDLLLESPFDTARSAWDRHTQLILRYGRSIWLWLTPENLTDSPQGIQDSVREHGPSFVVFSPFAVTTKQTAQGTRAQLVHANGTVFTASEDELISCSWWDPTGTPGETTSVLKPIADELASVEVAQHAVWAALDNARNQRVMVQIPDGMVAIDSGKTSEPAATRIVKKSKAAWLVGELAARVRMTRESRTRDAGPRIPIAFTRAPEDAAITRTMTQPEIDGGLVELATWAREQVAIVASVPTSQLTGEQPKYANLFATRDQFVRSTAGAVAFHVADSAMPAVRRWKRETSKPQKLVLSLDPAALIEKTPTVVTQQAAEPVAAANVRTANQVLGRKTVAGLNTWQKVTIPELERLAALIAAESLAAEPVAAGFSDQIEKLVERIIGRVAQLRRLKNRSATPTDLDRANVEKAVTAEIERAIASGSTGAAVTVRSVRDGLATSLFGPSRISTEQNPTLLDRLAVVSEFPNLGAEGSEPIEWEWSWTPPGDPGRTPFPEHLDHDGVTWFEGEPQPGTPGGDANGENCQCVIQLAVPVEASV